jgi:predicted glutamine amidotransferase
MSAMKQSHFFQRNYWVVYAHNGETSVLEFSVEKLLWYLK